MRVKRLQLTNFRGFASLDLDLDHPLTILVGPNGVGKSTLLSAIASACGGFAQRVLTSRIVLVPSSSDIGAASNFAETTVLLTSKENSWTGGFYFSREKEHTNRQPRASPLHPPTNGFFLVFFGTERGLRNAEVQEKIIPRIPAPEDELESDPSWEEEDESTTLPRPGYERFVRWFKEREDVENEQRVAQGDLALQDPQLRAVREAVAELMPGFSRLRIQRLPRPVMVVTKGDTQFRLDQLSDGERNLIALTGELARRMAIASPHLPDPRQTEGVVLIDEIEQHMHPGLQREVLPRLRRAFPQAQFIVSTHSPQVLSTAPRDAIVAVENFTARRLARGAEGRDSNAILSEVFGVPERPARQVEQIGEIRRHIDEGRLDLARQRLDELAELLTEHDEDILALRMRLFVAGAEPPPGGATEAAS